MDIEVFYDVRYGGGFEALGGTVEPQGRLKISEITSPSSSVHIDHNKRRKFLFQHRRMFDISKIRAIVTSKISSSSIYTTNSTNVNMYRDDDTEQDDIPCKYVSLIYMDIPEYVDEYSAPCKFISLLYTDVPELLDVYAAVDKHSYCMSNDWYINFYNHNITPSEYPTEDILYDNEGPHFRYVSINFIEPLLQAEPVDSVRSMHYISFFKQLPASPCRYVCVVFIECEVNEVVDVDEGSILQEDEILVEGKPVADTSQSVVEKGFSWERKIEEACYEKPIMRNL